MRMKLASLVVVLVASGALVSTAVAEASSAAVTKVTIKGPQGDFQGKILSDKTKCLGNRNVTVFQQKGAYQAPGTDKQIASDTSQKVGNHGEWSVGNSGYKDGKFYARASKSEGCKAGSSKTIKLVNGVPQ